jgi:hypothetical protein
MEVEMKLLFVLLILFATSCKNDLTVEQARLKIEFEDNVSTMKNLDQLNIILLLKSLNDYYQISTTPIGKTKKEIELYELFNESIFNYTKNTIENYNKAITVYNGAKEKAEHLKRILEATGVKVDFKDFNLKVIPYRNISFDDFNWTITLRFLIEDALKGKLNFKSANGEMLSPLSNNINETDSIKKSLQNFIKKLSDVTYMRRVDAELFSKEELPNTLFFKSLIRNAK